MAKHEKKVEMQFENEALQDDERQKRAKMVGEPKSMMASRDKSVGRRTTLSLKSK
jgi:hypothetical protein